VVGAARLSQAMSADVGSNNASRMLGPTLSGIIFASVGIGGTFVISVLLYLVALYAAVTLRYRSGVQPANGQGVLARIAQGIAVVRGDPRLWGTLVVTAIFNIFGWPFTSLVPVVAQEHLQLAPKAIGILASMDGVGSFVGALLMGVWARPAIYRRCYVGGVALYLLMLTLFALAPHSLLSGAALFLTGFGQSGFSVMQATLIYLAAPPEMRSRVLGLLSVCIGLGPIGFVHVGLLADAIGAHWACVVSGVEGLLALLLTRRWWRQI
jgi:predicted MFS family arabinose efflux permease